jgi:hypothetical protein
MLYLVIATTYSSHAYSRTIIINQIITFLSKILSTALLLAKLGKYAGGWVQWTRNINEFLEAYDSQCATIEALEAT